MLGIMATSRREQAAHLIGYHLAQAILIALETVRVDRGPFPDATPPEPPTRPPGALLDVNDVATRLNVPVKTVYDWRSRPVPYGPPAMKVGRYLRWKPEAVDRWLEAQNEACVLRER